MTEQTIEEAWAALNPKPGRAYRNGKFTSDADLARALALAVLDEAMSLPEPPLLGTIEINISEREAVLRARIEALGR